MFNDFSFKDDNFKIDCRYFIGEKPCKFKRECTGCNDYSPMGYRILIIKLGAMGDVLRTTPVLEELKKQHPGSHITWVVDAQSFDLLKNNTNIDVLLTFDLNSIIRLENESFDKLICFEKELRAAALAKKVTSKDKFGFGLSPYGTLYPFNSESLYAFRLGVSDDLKFFRNEKSYQQIVFEMLDFKFEGQEYVLNTDKKDQSYAKNIYKNSGFMNDDIVIGICPGSGDRFVNKSWVLEGYIELIERLVMKKGLKFALLGGPGEKEKLEEIKNKLGDKVFNTGCNHSITEFTAVINMCDLVICGDTLPMHIAIALKKKVLAIFGPTCHQEIDLYGRGEKIVTDIDCFPCYRSSCNVLDHCMKRISVDTVYESVINQLSSLQ